MARDPRPGAGQPPSVDNKQGRGLHSARLSTARVFACARAPRERWDRG
jgi:hypothetical protein